MFTPSKGRFDRKDDLIDRSLRASKEEHIKAQIRQCKKCGSQMHIKEQIKTVLNFIFTVPGFKYKFKCTNCSKEIIIRSPDRFFLTMVFAVISIVIIFSVIILEAQDMISGYYNKSDLLYLVIALIILSVSPIQLIAEIYQRKKYPVLKK